jgi:DnaJ-class molecular chaperone
MTNNASLSKVDDKESPELKSKCTECDGRGEIMSCCFPEPCPVCRGKGWVIEKTGARP